MKIITRGSAVLLFSLVFVIMWTLPPRFLGAQESFLHHEIRSTLLSGDREKMVDEIVAWTEARKGYFLRKASDTVVVRIPAESVNDFRHLLETAAEDVVEYVPEAYNLKEEYLSLQSGIKSREEILEKNMEYLGKTDLQGTLAVEQEITRLITEIEGLKGRLRRITTDIRYALGYIQLELQQQSLPEDIPSSFGWINRVDFYDFIEAGSYGGY